MKYIACDRLRLPVGAACQQVSQHRLLIAMMLAIRLQMLRNMRHTWDAREEIWPCTKGSRPNGNAMPEQTLASYCRGMQYLLTRWARPPVAPGTVSSFLTKLRRLFSLRVVLPYKARVCLCIPPLLVRWMEATSCESTYIYIYMP